MQQPERKEIGQRIRQNQATVMRICQPWMQEETTELRSRSCPLRCTTACDDWRNVRMTVMDHATTSRTITQPIQSVRHNSVSPRTIRRHLQQSGILAKRQLLRS
ncbi:transposable element Tcb1 transposase [Trichonephila clavipes]|nr:transposable element Tcb1 transposase [Trichonephila clavipes]